MFYCLQCSINHLEFSRVHPYPQYRHLVLKNGTTTGQQDIWSDCRSVWCLIRCTPSPHHPLCPSNPQSLPPVQASGGQEQYYIRSDWHLVSLWPVYARINLVPEPMVIPVPWADIKLAAVKKLMCYCLQFSIDCLYFHPVCNISSLVFKRAFSVVWTQPISAISPKIFTPKLQFASQNT